MMMMRRRRRRRRSGNRIVWSQRRTGLICWDFVGGSGALEAKRLLGDALPVFDFVRRRLHGRSPLCAPRRLELPGGPILLLRELRDHRLRRLRQHTTAELPLRPPVRPTLAYIRRSIICLSLASRMDECFPFRTCSPYFSLKLSQPRFICLIITKRFHP
jgi:hypothetical protein